MPKTPIVGECRLCRRSAELQNSHIVSKFIWRDSGLTGAQKSFDVHCLSDPASSLVNLQDGFKEYLLCAICEGRFGNWERYVKPRLSALCGENTTRPADGCFVTTGWDYHKTKLFTMSLLWRMGISTHPFYGMVRLGKHEEILRKMLLSNIPGEHWRYGCAIALLTHNRNLVPSLFHQPESFLVGKRFRYRIVISGTIWFFDVGSHPTATKGRDMYLKHDGDWLMVQSDLREFKFLRDQIELLNVHVGANEMRGDLASGHGRHLKPEAG